MKKLLFLLVTLLLSVSLFACGEDEGDGDNGNGDTSGEGSGTAESYTVTWYSHDGNKITEETLTKGSVPSRTYNVIDTAEWDYTFLGWRSQPTGDALSTLPEISADVSYYASVTRAKRLKPLNTEHLQQSPTSPCTRGIALWAGLPMRISLYLPILQRQ